MILLFLILKTNTSTSNKLISTYALVNTDSFLPKLDSWGGYPPPELPQNKQYPHEGRISFIIPQWMKLKYPYLYPSIDKIQ